MVDLLRCDYCGVTEPMEEVEWMHVSHPEAGETDFCSDECAMLWTEALIADEERKRLRVVEEGQPEEEGEGA